MVSSSYDAVMFGRMVLFILYHFFLSTDFERRIHEAYNPESKSWQKVTFEKKVYLSQDGNPIDVRDAPNAQPFHVVSDADVNCPSIIFIVLPDDTTERYVNPLKFKSLTFIIV